MRMPSLRFSLRMFLLAAGLLPLTLYWLALPTLNAQRFAATVNAGDYPAAEQLCLDRERPFPGTWKKHRTFQPKATVKSLSLSDLRRGKRQLFVGIAYGDGDGLATCGVECTATKQGIEIGMSLP